MRAPTLAQHCRVVAAYTDTIVAAAHTGDLDIIGHVRDQVRTLQPPHGFDREDVLLFVLAAQIDISVPVQQRLAWVAKHDPANWEAA
jgi:hypothetical protein